MTGQVIKAMTEDIKREAEGEIIISPETLKQIGRNTAELYKEYMFNIQIKNKVQVCESCNMEYPLCVCENNKYTYKEIRNND